MNLIPWRRKKEHTDIERSFEHPLSRLREEMDSMFERFFRDPWGTSLWESLPARFGSGPRTDLAESENEVTVRAELPGVDPEDVDIHVTGQVLTIRGEKREEEEDEKRDYYYVERQFGSFHRTIQLPSSVDPSQVEAVFKNGVLTVTVAKRPEAKPKRIPVRTAE